MHIGQGTRRPEEKRPALARLRQFPLARSGVAAVEFALVLPVMLLMYLGMTEVTVAVNTDRKLTILSRTLADLTGRVSNVTDTDVNTIFGAALSVMAPFTSDDVKMRISSVVIRDNNGSPQARVCWSEGRNMTRRGANEIVLVPEGFDTPGTSFILAEVEKVYKPMLGHAITGDINLAESTPWPVRNVAEVTRMGTSCL
jgi:Flp pilus assembly protein TadG